MVTSGSGTTQQVMQNTEMNDMYATHWDMIPIIVGNLQEQQNFFHNDISRVHLRLAALEERLSDDGSDCSEKMRCDLATKNAELEKVRVTIHGYKTDLADARDRIVRQDHELAAMRKRLAQQQQDSAAAQRLADACQQANDTASHELEQARIKIAQCELHETDWVRQLNKTEQHNMVLQQKLDDLQFRVSDEDSSLRSELQGVRSELSCARDAAKDTERAAEKAASRHATVTQKQKKTIAELRASLTRAEAEVHSTREHLQQCTEEFEIERAALVAQTERGDELQRTIDDSSDVERMKELEKQLDSFQSTEARAVVLQNELTDANTMRAKYMDKVRELLRDRENHIKLYTPEHLEAELEYTMIDPKDCQVFIDAYRKRLDTLKSNIQRDFRLMPALKQMEDATFGPMLMLETRIASEMIVFQAVDSPTCCKYHLPATTDGADGFEPLATFCHTYWDCTVDNHDNTIEVTFKNSVVRVVTEPSNNCAEIFSSRLTEAAERLFPPQGSAPDIRDAGECVAELSAEVETRRQVGTHAAGVCLKA